MKIVDDVDDFMLRRYQWLSDAAYTIQDTISPWTLARQCFTGAAVMYSAYFWMKYPYFWTLMFLLIMFFATYGHIRDCQKKHVRWLEGKENAPEVQVKFSRIFWLFTTLVLATPPAEVIVFSAALYTSGFYFYSCSSPSKHEFRKLSHAGI